MTIKSNHQNRKENMYKIIIIFVCAIIVTISSSPAHASLPRILYGLNIPDFQKLNAQMVSQGYELGDFRDMRASSNSVTLDEPLKFDLIFYKPNTNEVLSKRFLMFGFPSSIRIVPFGEE